MLPLCNEIFSEHFLPVFIVDFDIQILPNFVAWWVTVEKHFSSLLSFITLSHLAYASQQLSAANVDENDGKPFSQVNYEVAFPIFFTGLKTG
ncbi:hypothetical protein VNO80_11586 [Phaseolus coccineus]|uniref:Uncharacterized protein n=1 Tax=Phaseolus coccineus TaxID=3886 RepID=A0AAN9REJ3_PHACN